MTAVEMKNYFLLLYDKNTSFDAPGYEDAEISLYLTTAQLRFIKTHYNWKGNKYRDGFDMTEKRRKDLAQLIRNAELTGVSIFSDTDNLPNGNFISLPSDFLWAIKEEATISYLDCNNITATPRIPVKPITYDEYTSNLKNPFKKPDATIAWRLDYSSDTTGKRHEVITNGSTLTTYHLRYIKMPNDIDITLNQDCELDESTHEEIVDIAVNIAIAITQDPRYQIMKTEQVTNE